MALARPRGRNPTSVPSLAPAAELAAALLRDARQARLQRSLALIAGLTSGTSGLEVGYMHYRASYGHRVMWTPIIMSQVLLGAGVWGALSPRAARTVLPAVSVLTLADCAVGFVFHIRGTARKPGGWRLLSPNLAMGPPPFAPLLFGMSAYMGIVAARMRPESALAGWPRPRAGARPANAGAGREAGSEPGPAPGPTPGLTPGPAPGPTPGEAKLQQHLAVICGISALCSGVEAAYSHWKNGFHYAAQWTPIAMAPLLAAAAFASASHPRRARRLLPAAAGLAMLDGAVGGFYHTRGVLRRPGGTRHLLHNVMYGPPVLAPLLFAASGFLGLLASVMRPPTAENQRERSGHKGRATRGGR